MARKFAFKQGRGTGCMPQCLGQQRTHRSYTVRAKDGSEYRRNKGHLLKSRTPQYTNEETSGNGGKPEASTTSEDRECDNGTESKPTINQRPTANQPAPVMGNEPCTTRSGRVVWYLTCELIAMIILSEIFALTVTQFISYLVKLMDTSLCDTLVMSGLFSRCSIHFVRREM